MIIEVDIFLLDFIVRVEIIFTCMRCKILTMVFAMFLRSQFLMATEG